MHETFWHTLFGRLPSALQLASAGWMADDLGRPMVATHPFCEESAGMIDRYWNTGRLFVGDKKSATGAQTINRSR